MPEHEVDIICEAARNAGAIALRYFGNHPKSWEKDGEQGPVSEADLAVNDYLREFFALAFPKAHFLSEEENDDLSRLQSEDVLVVDPIDGTKAFLEGQKYFAISIALIRNQTAHSAVIYAPALEDMYFASATGCAYCNDQRMNVSEETRLQNARILASRARYNRNFLEMTPPLKTKFRPSIALRLALVARGDFDLTIALRPSWDWDIAAGDLILQKSGGQLVTRDGTRPIYNQKTPKQNGIVAGGVDLVRHCLERMERGKNGI